MRFKNPFESLLTVECLIGCDRMSERERECDFEINCNLIEPKFIEYLSECKYHSLYLYIELIQQTNAHDVAVGEMGADGGIHVSVCRHYQNKTHSK